MHCMWQKPKTSVIPAVEVEPPGCSFNPPSESHQVKCLYVVFCYYWAPNPCNNLLHIFSIQDALACAVADEMQKIYRDELGPEPIPLIVSGEAVNEEDVSLSCYCLVGTFDHGLCRCFLLCFHILGINMRWRFICLRCISLKRTVGLTWRMKI